jgi:hypothetical protein
VSRKNELNTIISSLNSLGGPVLQKLFPGSTPHISAAHIPLANGTALVNKALIQLHLPTIDKLEWWGHFSLSGGTLILGSLILGLALLRRDGTPTPTSTLLIIFAPLNLLCQLFTSIPLNSREICLSRVDRRAIDKHFSCWINPANHPLKDFHT